MNSQRLRKLLILAGWFAATLAVTGAMMLLGRLDKAHVALIYVLVVLLASARVDRPIAFALAFFTFLCFNFFFLRPHYTLLVADSKDWLILAIYLLTAAVGAQLLYRARTLAQSETTLRDADKLKDALLAAVSHDLRTPLTTIKAIAQDLRAEGSAEAAIIEEEADRLNRMVADLLDLSKLRGGAVSLERQLNAVDDLLGAALQQVSGTITGREIIPTLDTDEPVLVGRFDFVHSLRILVNLLENADRYSPPGTPVEISVLREGDMLLLAVSDRGAGITAVDAARIYEPFVQGNPGRHGGTGLGLSIARGLAELQGGSLRHLARIGGGTIFELRLPAEDTPVDA
jgi:two-component system sensor histidine kinase KdpD